MAMDKIPALNIYCFNRSNRVKDMTYKTLSKSCHLPVKLLNSSYFRGKPITILLAPNLQ